MVVMAEVVGEPNDRARMVYWSITKFTYLFNFPPSSPPHSSVLLKSRFGSLFRFSS